MNKLTNALQKAQFVLGDNHELTKHLKTLMQYAENFPDDNLPENILASLDKIDELYKQHVS